LNKKYPFDPNLKHHLIIALGFAVWIFIFLFFTEPLDISVFNNAEKLTYLPLYSFAGALVYLFILPIQQWLFHKNDTKWFYRNELFILGLIIFIGLVVIRILFVYVVNEGFYSLINFIKIFYIPAILTLFPIIILSRWSFGRYYEKKIEDKKIEIKGNGNYENLKILMKDLVCIQSSDNYVEITYLEFEALKKALIRTKISTVKTTFPELLQTHRSFLINPSHFKQWNNNGKFEILLIKDIKIPISKTFIKNVKEILNLTTN